jgi:uncharacterized membrane protein YkoI
MAACFVFTACSTALAQGGKTQPTQPTTVTQLTTEPTTTAQTTQPTTTQPAPPATTRLPQPIATQPARTTTAPPFEISLDKAKKIALADAGFTAEQVTFNRVEKKRESGIMKYEIEFVGGGMEYEYEIHAATGTILKSKGKRAAESEPSSPSDVPGEIGLEKAKAIALEDAGFTADQVKFKKAKRDREHGIVIYEIKFEKDRWEYEYEIHAATGVILKKDIDD